MNMLFENNPIDISGLPAAENQDFNPLKKTYLILINIQWTIFILVLIVGVFTLFYMNDQTNAAELLYIISGLVVVFLTKLFINIKGFKIKGYTLREHDIIFRSGLLTRRTIAVPFNRIQHSEIRQGFLSRILGIARIKIFTAGGSSSDLSVPGLVPDEAQRIKDFLGNTIAGHE